MTLCIVHCALCIVHSVHCILLLTISGIGLVLDFQLMAGIHSARRVASAARARAQAIKSIRQALHRKTTKSKTKRSMASAHAKTKRSMASAHATHTRSQGDRPDPPVRLQTPRLRIEPPQYGIHDARFHCGACVEFLPDGTRLDLAATSLQESTLEGAGRGVIVKQYVPPNTIFTEYGGDVVSERVARSRRAKVISFVVCDSN
jgi:hypothetical protein